MLLNSILENRCENHIKGRILKGVGSFYTVLADDGEEHVCRARGKFRVEKLTPVVGDRVEITHNAGEEGYILSILPRKNLLKRPAVANLDKLIIVVSASAPKPDLLLVDKLMLQCELMDILPVLVINKCDEGEMDIQTDILQQYRHTDYPIHITSAETGQGIEGLRSELHDSICCFAGQSAVGKSSLLNALLPQLKLPVGGLSIKVERGKHTTRHAELWPAYGGAVLDTPGFSLLDLLELEPEQLAVCYPEMRDSIGECYFSECMHMAEPNCAVKEKLERGEISQGRYARYSIIAEELKEMRKHRYD